MLLLTQNSLKKIKKHTPSLINDDRFKSRSILAIFRMCYSRLYNFRIRKFQSSGAILVLVWNFVSVTLVISISRTSIYHKLIIQFCSLSFPIVGWLSDICVGRYKVIHYSLWITFCSVVITNISSAVRLNNIWNSHILRSVELVTVSASFLGSTGVLANTMQLGIDQLIDSSSENITSFLSWYFWMISLAVTLHAASQECHCGIYNSSLAYFIYPLMFAVALASDICMSKKLIMEPVTNNPFKLIYQVLKYAARNKYPRLRSAFTYWEDKPYSRLDLGKAKYGGPFTTEQVEDVKTFFRLMPTIAIFSSLFMVIFFDITNYSGSLLRRSLSLITTPCTTYVIRACYKKIGMFYLPWGTISLLIPFFEFLLYSMMQKCNCRIKSLYKIFFGTLLVFVNELSLLGLETASFLTKNRNNGKCSYDLNLTNVSDKNLEWLIASQLVMGVALYILTTSILEFIYAQSPYFMKGLLIGVTYFLIAIFLVLPIRLLKLLSLLIKTANKICGIWISLVTVGFTFAIICIILFIIKCYRYRKRDETLRCLLWIILANIYHHKELTFEVEQSINQTLAVEI